MGIFFTACSSDGRESFRLEVGKRYPLKGWPDSAYLHSMDSLVASEDVRPSQEKAPEITLSAKGVPSPFAKAVTHGAMARAAAAPSSSAQISRERFAEQFQKALEACLRDPSLARAVPVKSGESLDQVLRRVYGPSVDALPYFAIQIQLVALNPGINPQALSEGKILLPKL